MIFERISDESVAHYYENIRRLAEADRSHNHHLSASPAIRERAQKLREEMTKRGLPQSPIDWPSAALPLATK